MSDHFDDYVSVFSAHLERLCDVVAPEPDIPDIAHDIGLMFGEQWRRGESLKISEQQEEFKQCVLSHIKSLPNLSGSGVLKTNLETLKLLNSQLKHVFLTGTEEEHDEMVSVLELAESDEERAALIHDMVSRPHPPTIPRFDISAFGAPFVRIISLIVVREIANEALNDGSEGDDMEERALFSELREILFSIADAHKCVCYKNNDECECPRGGGFNSREIASLVVKYLSADGPETSPMNEIDIAEDILGASESETSSSGWEDDDEESEE